MQPFGSIGDNLILAAFHYPQENNETTEMWLNFLLGDCLELVACELAPVPWPIL